MLLSKIGALLLVFIEHTKRQTEIGLKHIFVEAITSAFRTKPYWRNAELPLKFEIKNYEKCIKKIYLY